MRRSEQPIPLRVGDHTVVVDWHPNDHALFVSLGAALAEIQAFESTIAFFLSGISGSGGDSSPTPDFDALMEHHTSKTLGWLAKHLRERVGDAALAASLDAAREKRNFLVHNILKKYGWWEMADSAYLDCIREIDEIRNVIASAQREIAKRLQDTGALHLVAISIDPRTGEITEL